jgi:hypothetical protein
MPDLRVWTMTGWPCVCGREHAPWWRTVPPPSCPHGWPREPHHVIEPVTYAEITRILGGPLPWP